MPLFRLFADFCPCLLFKKPISHFREFVKKKQKKEKKNNFKKSGILLIGHEKNQVSLIDSEQKFLIPSKGLNKSNPKFSRQSQNKFTNFAERSQ